MRSIVHCLSILKVAQCTYNYDFSGDEFTDRDAVEIELDRVRRERAEQAQQQETAPKKLDDNTGGRENWEVVGGEIRFGEYYYIFQPGETLSEFQDHDNRLRRNSPLVLPAQEDEERKDQFLHFKALSDNGKKILKNAPGDTAKLRRVVKFNTVAELNDFIFDEIYMEQPIALHYKEQEAMQLFSPHLGKGLCEYCRGYWNMPGACPMCQQAQFKLNPRSSILSLIYESVVVQVPKEAYRVIRVDSQYSSVVIGSANESNDENYAKSLFGRNKGYPMLLAQNIVEVNPVSEKVDTKAVNPDMYLEPQTSYMQCLEKAEEQPERCQQTSGTTLCEEPEPCQETSAGDENNTSEDAEDMLAAVVVTTQTETLSSFDPRRIKKTTADVEQGTKSCTSSTRSSPGVLADPCSLSPNNPFFLQIDEDAERRCDFPKYNRQDPTLTEEYVLSSLESFESVLLPGLVYEVTAGEENKKRFTAFTRRIRFISRQDLNARNLEFVMRNSIIPSSAASSSAGWPLSRQYSKDAVDDLISCHEEDHEDPERGVLKSPSSSTAMQQFKILQYRSRALDNSDSGERGYSNLQYLRYDKFEEEVSMLRLTSVTTLEQLRKLLEIKENRQNGMYRSHVVIHGVSEDANAYYIFFETLDENNQNVNYTMTNNTNRMDRERKRGKLLVRQALGALLDCKRSLGYNKKVSTKNKGRSASVPRRASSREEIEATEKEEQEKDDTPQRKKQSPAERMLLIFRPSTRRSRSCGRVSYSL